MTDPFDIPDFLRRPFDEEAWRSEAQRFAAKRSTRTRKIAYPKDGYFGKGLRKKARERLREKRQLTKDQRRRARLIAKMR